MALSGLDIYKLLPKTNCRECGFATCLAFAMQLAKKAVSIDKCPYISEESKRILEASSLPPIKLVNIGVGQGILSIGSETVMFRHEEKFHNPCGLGFIIDDNQDNSSITKEVEQINKLELERVGQKINVNMIAVRQTGGTDRFLEAARLVSSRSSLALMLIASDVNSISEALKITKDKRPLIYIKDSFDIIKLAQLAREYKVPLVAYGQTLGDVINLTQELNKQGVNDIVIETGKKAVKDKVWDLTQIRRQALKKSNRSLGYPVLVTIENDDPYSEAIEAATYITKYASLILLKGIETWKALALLTLRQNIYTDPQKPLQVEPNIYPVGQVTKASPVLITTNFSLSYYTVLSEVEASKVPSYIISVDTEGMSVLTAWAAEKFTPERISNFINKLDIINIVSHKRLIIPGYVAVMSGDLEERSGWGVTVGPKEAAGIPSFLKNLS